MTYRFNIGDPVVVLDGRGEYELRGSIAGRYAAGVNHPGENVYDIQPGRAESLSKRMCGVPEAQLRYVGKPILAYERKPEPGPRMILDES